MPSLTAPLPRPARQLAYALAAILPLALMACGDDKGQVKNIRSQVMQTYGEDKFQQSYELAVKGLELSRKVNGDKAADTLYLAQAISEASTKLGNARLAIPALKQEIAMRAAAGQPEQKLQARRTLLIQFAEESGDKLTAADQALAVSKGIEMGPGKDPQPVYRPQTTYPIAQYQQKVEGDVEIAYSLDTTGKVTEARVARATPPAVFDQAALESFRKWRFTPMLDREGKPVSASGLKFTLAFRLGGR